MNISEEALKILSSVRGLKSLLLQKKVEKALEYVEYSKELEKLQVELVKLQREVKDQNRRVLIIIEGRDCAGKGGAIFRLTKHLPPREIRVVALPKPTNKEKGQWYFQRYSSHLPNPGEMVFFDRSWYNRAVVEPVNGFCSPQEYKHFMDQVNSYEEMLINDGVEIIKLWFSISKETQAKRLKSRKKEPLKQWKVSPVDEKAQELFDLYTQYKDDMFKKTSTKKCPWFIIDGNNKKRARIASIRHILQILKYENKIKKLVNKNNPLVKKFSTNKK